jgi:hypothetical protein
MELQKLTRCKLRSFIAWPSSHVSDMTVPALIYMTEYSKKVAIYCIYAQTENIRDKKISTVPEKLPILQGILDLYSNQQVMLLACLEKTISQNTC